MDNKELLSRAIVKIREKNRPKVNTPEQYVPEAQHKSLLDMLEVWGQDREAEDSNEKARYIYDTLSPQGKPKEILMSIFTELGVTPMGEKKIDRVYRFIKLRNQAAKALQQFDHYQKEISAISNH